MICFFNFVLFFAKRRDEGLSARVSRCRLLGSLLLSHLHHRLHHLLVATTSTAKHASKPVLDRKIWKIGNVWNYLKRFSWISYWFWRTDFDILKLKWWSVHSLVGELHRSDRRMFDVLESIVVRRQPNTKSRFW